MADEIDRAQECEQAERDRALKATLERIRLSHQPRDPSVENFCIECEQPIGAARMKAVKTSRCKHCADAFELRARGFAHVAR